MADKLHTLYMILLIFILLMFISIYFFNVDPIYETKNKIKEIKEMKEEANIEKVIVDGEELIVDNPLFTQDRFNNITYSIQYQENETTDFIVVNFKDDSGYLNNKCYDVDQLTIEGVKTLCNVCSEKVEDEMWCDMHNYSGGSLFGNFNAYGGGSLQTFGSDDIKKIVVAYWT